MGGMEKMKFIDYMREHDGENLSWCKPYVDDSGKFALIMCEGKPLAICAPGKYVFDDDDNFSAELEDFARAVNLDYDLYQGWSDLQIALFALHETGCAACPMCEDCEPMNETMGEE